MIREVPEVVLWAASVQHGVRPGCLDEVRLTTPLRSPPVVVKEVMKAEEISKKKSVHPYIFNSTATPVDGPPVKIIQHTKDQSGHTDTRPYNCVECGHRVAMVLEELSVGLKAELMGN